MKAEHCTKLLSSPQLLPGGRGDCSPNSPRLGAGPAGGTCRGAMPRCTCFGVPTSSLLPLSPPAWPRVRPASSLPGGGRAPSAAGAAAAPAAAAPPAAPAAGRSAGPGAPCAAPASAAASSASAATSWARGLKLPVWWLPPLLLPSREAPAGSYLPTDRPHIHVRGCAMAGLQGTAP